MNKMFKVLNDIELIEYEGGKYCSVFDVECWGWPSVKKIGGMIGSGPTRPTVCIPKSSWNPAPAVPCP